MLLSDLRLCERELRAKYGGIMKLEVLLHPVPVCIYKDAREAASTTLRVLSFWNFSLLLLSGKCYHMVPESSRLQNSAFNDIIH